MFEVYLRVSENNHCKYLHKAEIFKWRFLDFRISNICFGFLINLNFRKDKKVVIFSSREQGGILMKPQTFTWWNYNSVLIQGESRCEKRSKQQ